MLRPTCSPTRGSTRWSLVVADHSSEGTKKGRGFLGTMSILPHRRDTIAEDLCTLTVFSSSHEIALCPRTWGRSATSGRREQLLPNESRSFLTTRAVVSWGWPPQGLFGHAWEWVLLAVTMAGRSYCVPQCVATPSS